MTIYVEHVERHPLYESFPVFMQIDVVVILINPAKSISVHTCVYIIYWRTYIRHVAEISTNGRVM
jgi:hypothetical protein